MARPRALALAVALLPALTLAQPRAERFVSAPLGLTVTLPRGFVAVPSRDASDDHLGAWRRGAVLVELVHLDAPVPQRALTATERAALRVADPFAFDDRVERSPWRGHSLETLRGLSARPPAFRLATAVPLVDDGVLLAVYAPGDREAEARAVHAAVLASTDALTEWRTPAQRVGYPATKAAGAVALALMAGYAVAAWVARRRRREWSRPLRGVAVSAAVLWAGVTVGLLTCWPRAMVCAATQSAALAAVMVFAAVRATKREEGEA